VVSAVVSTRHALHQKCCSVFIYFKEYSDTEQSLTYPSKKLVKAIGFAVT
jgi:hypothetical protein